MNSKPEHWRDELYKAYVERWQAREAAESESRKQAGKISIWLERASDDADTFTAEHQAELRAVVTALRDQGIGIEAPFMAMDAADAVGGYTGQIVIELIKAASPLLTGAVIAWLKGRAGRKVRVEFYPGGKLKSIEAQTEGQVLAIAEALDREAQAGSGIASQDDPA